MAKVVNVKLIKSMIGRPENQRNVLRGMGLTKVNRRVALEDTPSIRGMIQKVSHLVSVEETSDEIK